MIRLQRRQRGSILFLMPAAVLVMVVLAGLSLEAGFAHHRQRDLAHVADAAVNDAVAFGLNQELLRDTGRAELDPDRVHAAILASIESQGRDEVAVVSWSIAADGASVTVLLEREIQPFLGGALPGMGPRRLGARATASLASS